MIIVDRNTANQIIVTASEKGIDNSLRLKVFSPFTQKTYYKALGSNLSLFPERYDMYALTGITDWEGGVYQYELQDYNEVSETVTQIVEVGLMKVIGETAEAYVSIPKAETADDFLVYTLNS